MKNAISKQLYYLVLIIGIAILTLQSCNKPLTFKEGHQSEIGNSSPFKKKVLFISIEGGRGDVIQNANLFNINNLASSGVSSWSALSDTQTFDRTSWAALFTGVHSDKSGIKSDSYLENNFKNYPTFFERIKRANPNIQTIVINSTPSINDSIIKPADANKILMLPNDDIVQDSVLKCVKDSSVDFLFVNYSGANIAGRESSYSSSSDKYLAALNKIDGYIGKLITTLRGRSNYSNEQWMIIITSNHGGTQGGHYGGDSPQERNTFVIFNVPGLASKQIVKPDVNVPYDGLFPYFTSTDGKDHSAYINNTDPYNFGATQDFTIEFKIKSIGSTSDNPIISNKNWSSGGNQGWLIFLYNGNIRVNFKGADGTRLDAKNGPVVNDNIWHHISVVFHRQGNISIYNNGKFFIDGGSISGQGDIDTDLPLAIGSDGTLNYNVKYSAKLQSYLSDIRIWKTALTDEEINQWAFRSSLIGHPEYKNLIGYWKANEGLSANNTVTDFSPTKADLSIQNGLQWDNLNAVLNPSSLDAASFVPNSVDVAANIFAWLGIKWEPSWQLDSKLWIVP